MHYLRLLSLASFLLIFISLDAAGFEIMLKNGKKLHGALLFEDELTIRIVDKFGVQYSLKKSSLDLETIKKLREMKNTESKSKQTPEISPDTPSTGEARPQQKTHSKIYNNEDIRDLPNFTEPGTVKIQDFEYEDDKKDSADKGNTKESKKIVEEKTEEKQRQYWREKYEKLKEHIAELEKHYQQAQFECSRSGGHNSMEILIDLEDRRFVQVKNTNCQKEDFLKEVLNQANDDLFEFEQSARREGILLIDLPWKE